MKAVLASLSASISELKRNPSALIEQADGEPVAILNHNTPTAYLVPAERFEEMMEQIDDHQLAALIREREAERDQAIPVNPDEL